MWPDFLPGYTSHILLFFFDVITHSFFFLFLFKKFIFVHLINRKQKKSREIKPHKQINLRDSLSQLDNAKLWNNCDSTCLAQKLRRCRFCFCFFWVSAIANHKLRLLCTLTTGLFWSAPLVSGNSTFVSFLSVKVLTFMLFSII